MVAMMVLPRGEGEIGDEGRGYRCNEKRGRTNNGGKPAIVEEELVAATTGGDIAAMMRGREIMVVARGRVVHEIWDFAFFFKKNTKNNWARGLGLG